MGVLVDVLHLVVDDCSMAVTVAELRGAGVDFGASAAVHAARPNETLPMGGLTASVAPEPYEGLGVGVMDLNR
ncbi:hypothetical protein ACIPSJ_02030 [Streptomyces sp. NPDC090088]|uniref:hypothetical protein n=1 Tax=Streptomyces sp. NPDC090088 TaxID=3365944 RepID=UPI00380F9263